ncbi:AMP-dependent synthetase/ligase [Mycetocola spongiae]|uniref:AMP-dependent synthetase/ligase n=1 Tax=Mycetocola spongiae TaxID=2859226 RepID=UPI001CF2CB35|nr:AMP-dependent synthetase/ligase [Mycetocola spongiae]UCR89799.1 long-chain fatty acid--CoA ligase [Mycetocola spongiae]
MAQFEIPAVVPADPEANTTDLLIERVRLTPDRVLFSIPNGDGWDDVTATEFLSQVVALAKGLVASGVEPGQKIGLLAKTSYQWTLIDFATWFAGAVLVPIYETSSPTQIQWILSDSEATAVIVETAEHFARFDEVHADLPLIGPVLQLDLGALDKLVAAGAAVPDEEIERRRNLARGEDMATLIYTSGSTGRPKGCVIMHSNFVELSRNAAVGLSKVVETPGASTVIFLTLAHVFARFISVLAMYAGVRTGHQHDTTKLMPALATFKPTFLLVVPRVLEKVYNSAEQKAETGGKGKIFRKASATAIEYSKALDAGKVSFGLRARFKLYDTLVLSKLRAAMGGNVEYAVSGSAPLGPRLGHFFKALGLTVLEGYGLTETTAPATVNRPEKTKIGTVGIPMPGTAVRTAPDGEIEVRGNCVFKEYWNNPEATEEAFNDGWFRTGDLGEFDSEGYLTVTGRKKEIIVTAGGKNVAPAALEDPVRANPLVSQIVVVGDRRPFIAALITIDAEMLPTWLKNNGADTSLTVEQAAHNPAVLAEIQGAIDAANTRVSRAESIRKFVILTHDFTEASGHLTPKMSIKRGEIMKDYADVVDGIYAATPTQNVSLK